MKTLVIFFALMIASNFNLVLGSDYRPSDSIFCPEGADIPCRLISDVCAKFVLQAVSPDPQNDPQQQCLNYAANFDACAQNLTIADTAETLTGCASPCNCYRRFRRSPDSPFHYRNSGEKFRPTVGYVKFGPNEFEKFVSTIIDADQVISLRRCMLEKNGFIDDTGAVLTDRLQTLASAIFSNDANLLASIQNNINRTICQLDDTFEVFNYMMCVAEPCIGAGVWSWPF